MAPRLSPPLNPPERANPTAGTNSRLEKNGDNVMGAPLAEGQLTQSVDADQVVPEQGLCEGNSG